MTALERLSLHCPACGSALAAPPGQPREAVTVKCTMCGSLVDGVFWRRQSNESLEKMAPVHRVEPGDGG